MIRLGHIDYSNCVPVHALLLEAPQAGIELVRDVPSRLNAALAAGAIDAAPCSSIEYARHADEYRILPGHAIGSDGAVGSILFESSVPLTALQGALVAIPTASATSVVLLRILLERRYGVTPRYQWYDQTVRDDAGAAGAAATLRIGDVALTRQPARDTVSYDLGAEWRAWTGLPFAFAVWQVRRELAPGKVQQLHDLLQQSRAYFRAHEDDLAARYAPIFALTPERLLGYWQSLRFDLDDRMQEGLLAFYRMAAELGETPPTPTLDIVTFR